MNKAGARRESSGTAKLRRVVSTVMAVNAAYSDEQKLQEYHETLRLSIGDAVRRFIPQPLPSSSSLSGRSGSSAAATTTVVAQQTLGGDQVQPAAFDAEQFTSCLVEQFYAILGPELKSLSHSKERVQKLESELDFLSLQMQRRDELGKTQREELLHELQAANEHVRQLAMMYNDLVESNKRAKKTGVQHQQRNPRPFDTTSSSTGVAGLPASPVGGNEDDEIESSAGNLDHTTGAPSTTSRGLAVASGTAYLAQLVSTTVIARQMDNAWGDLDASTKIIRREEELKADYEIKNRATLKQLRHEHSVAIQKLTRKQEETLRSETMKLETKVKQLEGQLRKRELENEAVVRTERERWKNQMQRVVDSSQGKLRSVTVNLRRQCEIYQMTMHDMDAHYRITIGAVNAELAAANTANTSLESEVALLKQEVEAAAAASGSGGGANDELVFTSSRHNLSVAIPDKLGLSNSSDAGVVASLAPGSRKERSPIRNVSVVSGDKSAPGQQQSRRSKSTTLAQMKVMLDSASAEAAALREQLDKAEVELAVTRIARNEAIEERNSLQTQVNERLTTPMDSTGVSMTSIPDGVSYGYVPERPQLVKNLRSSAGLKAQSDKGNTSPKDRGLQRTNTKNLSRDGGGGGGLKSTKSLLRTPAASPSATNEGSGTRLRAKQSVRIITSSRSSDRKPEAQLPSFPPSPAQDTLPNVGPLAPDCKKDPLDGQQQQQHNDSTFSSSSSSVLSKGDVSTVKGCLKSPASPVLVTAGTVAGVDNFMTANSHASSTAHLAVPVLDKFSLSASNISMLESIDEHSVIRPAQPQRMSASSLLRRVIVVDAAAQTDSTNMAAQTLFFQPGSAALGCPSPISCDEEEQKVAAEQQAQSLRLGEPTGAVATSFGGGGASVLGAAQLITTSSKPAPEDGGGGTYARVPKRPHSARASASTAATGSDVTGGSTENVAAGTGIVMLPTMASSHLPPGLRLSGDAPPTQYAVTPISIMLATRQAHLGSSAHPPPHLNSSVRPMSASTRREDDAERFAGALIVTPLSPRPPTMSSSK